MARAALLAVNGPQDSDDDPAYAGFWIRVLALVIDNVIAFVIIGVPLSLIYGEAYLRSTKIIHGFWDFMLGLVLPAVATIWFWRRYRGTPGKMLLKLRIVNADDFGPISTRQAVIRFFGYLPAMLAVMIGLVWIAFDPRKQGWHDKLAGTVVLKQR